MMPGIHRIPVPCWLRLAPLLAVLLAFQTTVAAAQSLIRDAEIERSLKRIAAPLFRAAGVNASQIDLLVVNDPSLNAFVMDGTTIFIHEGLIRRLPNVEMLQSVIAHELAHITSGHLVRRELNMQDTRTAIGLGMLLGVVAATASGRGDVGTGVMLGTASVAKRQFMVHTRAEETTADQIGTRYLIRAGIDPKAALDVMEIFRGQEAVAVGRQDPYNRTHPLSRQRITTLKAVIAAYGGRKTWPDVENAYWFSRMKAKFRGFVGNPTYILRHLDKNATDEFTRLARAIALHRQGKREAAVREMNRLIEKRPDDAYYHELKGQILLEGGDPKHAITFYRKAVALAPNEPLILAGLGRAELAQGSRKATRQALADLRKARQMDPRDARMLRDLAIAWARNGNRGMASLVTAERYALLTRFKDAQTNAKRAAGLLPRGSSAWLRAQDLLAATKLALRK